MRTRTTPLQLPLSYPSASQTQISNLRPPQTLHSNDRHPRDRYSPCVSPPATQSPSISVSTLSNFTIADVPDDESLIDRDGFPFDPATVARHKTFYLEDENVEVLCGNTLFRVHTSVLSFHSPTLRRTFAQTDLATAESPNGCRRILFSDTATDFATLLKMIYLPRFVASPVCR